MGTNSSRPCSIPKPHFLQPSFDRMLSFEVLIHQSIFAITIAYSREINPNPSRTVSVIFRPHPFHPADRFGKLGTGDMQKDPPLTLDQPTLFARLLFTNLLEDPRNVKL